MAQIDTTLHVSVKEGRIEEFKRLVEEMGKVVERNEPGTKKYQFYLNDDETQCVLNESYVNLDAALAHLKGIAFLTIFPKIFNISKIDRFEVFVKINESIIDESVSTNWCSELPFSRWLFSVMLIMKRT
jgi:quinol monooxygenase YgiN